MARYDAEKALEHEDVTVKTLSQSSKTVIHLPKDKEPEESWPGFGAVIQKYRKEEGLSQPELAKIMGTSRNTITNWETDKNQPSLDDTKTLCELLAIPLYEFFGISNHSIPSPHEQTVLKQYRKLSRVSRNTVDAMTRTMLQQEVDARNDILRDSYFILPLQSTAAAAGPGNAFNDLKPQPFFVKKNRFNAEADTLIRVSGHSMEPVYHDGDIVYVKYTTDVENNDIVICTTADGAVIKRMYENKLYSLNPQYPYGEKSEDDHVQVVGKVIGTVSADEIPDAEDAAILKELKSDELYGEYESFSVKNR